MPSARTAGICETHHPARSDRGALGPARTSRWAAMQTRQAIWSLSRLEFGHGHRERHERIDEITCFRASVPKACISRAVRLRTTSQTPTYRGPHRPVPGHGQHEAKRADPATPRRPLRDLRLSEKHRSLITFTNSPTSTATTDPTGRPGYTSWPNGDARRSPSAATATRTPVAAP